MNDAEKIYLIRNYSVQLEKILKEHGAIGQGIKELSFSIQAKTPNHIQDKIKKCNHLRNKVMHEAYNPTNAEIEVYQQEMQQILEHFAQKSTSKRSKQYDWLYILVIGWAIVYLLYRILEVWLVWLGIVFLIFAYLKFKQRNQ